MFLVIFPRKGEIKLSTSSDSCPVLLMATRSSKVLAQDIEPVLKEKLPVHLIPKEGILSRPIVDQFSNENLEVQVQNVRDRTVVVIHTQAPPVNESLVELIALLSAIRDAKPSDTILVFPYMPYARSDRKNKPRISMMAGTVADIINLSLGVERVVLVDPHDTHIKHYYHPVADEVSAVYLLVDHLSRQFFQEHDRKDCVMVFPDAGAFKRFDYVAHLLHLPVVHINKYRPDNSERAEIHGVIGEVKDKDCILIDDEMLTGGTVMDDSVALAELGAKSITVVNIHAPLMKKGVSDRDLIQRLEDSVIDKFIITDTIPVREKLKGTSKFEIVPVAGLLAETISRVVQNKSLTKLHNLDNVDLYRI